MNTNHTKRDLLQKLQDFMASYQGKVVLNYAYSWGAAIVILGTLFKLTHLPGANMMLWIGMGTEVLVFFISAFDLPVFRSGDNGNQPSVNIQMSEGSIGDAGQSDFFGLPQGTINITASSSAPAVGQGGGTGGYSGGGYSGGGGGGGYSPAVSPEMEEATTNYLQQLNEMSETIARFTKQAESLSLNADQMSVMNKNLTGINAIYEMQLRSVSSQIGTIDQVHEQTRKMAKQIEELNAVYTRMLEAMNVGIK